MKIDRLMVQSVSTLFIVTKGLIRCLFCLCCLVVSHFVFPTKESLGIRLLNEILCGGKRTQAREGYIATSTVDVNKIQAFSRLTKIDIIFIQSPAVAQSKTVCTRGESQEMLLACLA
jgi:hypothetical protein